MNDFESEVYENDKLVYEIARQIDNDFFLESIKSQIDSGIDECSSTNYLERFYMKVEQVLEEYQGDDYDKVMHFKRELCSKIVLWISDKYSLDLDSEAENVEETARQLYSFFIIELKDILISFFTSYIIEEYASVIKLIGLENLKTDFIPAGIDDEDIKYKFIAGGNTQKLVEMVANSSLGFDIFIRYASRMGDSEAMYEINTGNHILNNIDCTDVYETIMKEIINGTYDHSILFKIYEIILQEFNITKRQVSIYGQNFDLQYEQFTDDAGLCDESGSGDNQSDAEPDSESTEG